MSVDNLGENKTRMKWTITSMAAQSCTVKEQERGEEGETRKHLVRYRHLIRTSLTTIVTAYLPYGGNLCPLAGANTDQSPDMGPLSSILPVSYVFRRHSSCPSSRQVSAQHGPQTTSESVRCTLESIHAKQNHVAPSVTVLASVCFASRALFIVETDLQISFVSQVQFSSPRGTNSVMGI